MQEEIKLRSGRVLTPNCGILGLERRADRWYITEGYDNLADYDSSWGETYEAQLTDSEREQIAAMMISRWFAWMERE